MFSGHSEPFAVPIQVEVEHQDGKFVANALGMSSESKDSSGEAIRDISYKLHDLLRANFSQGDTVSVWDDSTVSALLRHIHGI